MGENLKISIFFQIPPQKYLKKISPSPPPPSGNKYFRSLQKLASFLKNDRYIKHEKSHYLLAVIYNSVIKLLYYFVKTAFGIFTSQIFHVIYKSMIKCLIIL